MTRTARTFVWTFAAVLVILVGRAIAYALNPSPLAQMLAHRVGGPSLPVVTLVALAFGIGVAVLVCWLAVLGVRERALLERRTLSSPLPRLRPTRLLATAFALWAVTSVCGGLFEAYAHWRAGLGWHGLHCLVGPVHRDLLPIFGALSLVAAAILSAADVVVIWMRRTFALLRGAVPRSFVATPARPVDLHLPRALERAAVRGARPPPAFS
jgi:hypothetical protein